MAPIQLTGVEIVRDSVRSEWIDLNGHMNVASYVSAFEVAVYALWQRFGMQSDYQEQTGKTTFAVETHTTYSRELSRNDPFLITGQVLAYDEKAVHNFLRMYDLRDGFVAATIEWMGLHVDLDTRHVWPWPEHVLDGIREFVVEQGSVRMPPEAGRRIGVRKSIFDAYGERE